MASSGTSGSVADDEVRTLIEYAAGEGGATVGDDLVLLFHNLQYACKRIAALVASPFNSSLGKHKGLTGGGASAAGSGRDAPKPLDIVSVSLTSRYNCLQEVCILSAIMHTHVYKPMLFVDFILIESLEDAV